MNKQLIKLMAAFAVALPVMFAALASPEPACAQESGVPLPVLPKAAKGKQCIEPVGIMRRYHMVFLYHQRNETMRQGIRGKKYSLKKCIECHASTIPTANGGTARSVQPFCEQCHKYAAVKIDCFSCHNPVVPPDKTSGLSIGDKAGKDLAMLKLKITAHLSAGVSAGLFPDKGTLQ